ncbi:hypothetical protein JVU11DRAFT_1230 [Chiua virens]|nr:hypothetical protein JVU11DRAFT_1230 [Chiua virens]
MDYKNFFKVIKLLSLNSVIEPVWIDWALLSPSNFITVELLHQFHQFTWDHDVKQYVTILGVNELNFYFSII